MYTPTEIMHESRILTWVCDELSKGISWMTMTVFAALLLVILVHKRIKKNGLLPPGPNGLPFVGMIPLIKKEFHLFLYDLSKIYGGIFSFRMGSSLIVVLSDPKLVKKAFARAEFSARPKTEFSSILGGYGKSSMILHLLKNCCFLAPMLVLDINRDS